VSEDPAGQAAGQPQGRPAAGGEEFVVAGGMAGRQGAERPQEVGDGAVAEGEDGGQRAGDEAGEGGTGKGPGQGVEERVGGRWDGLVDLFEFAAGGPGLACPPLAAFAVEASHAPRLAGVWGRGAALATRGGAGVGGAAILDMGASGMSMMAGYLHCIKKAPSWPHPSKRAEVELRVCSINRICVQ
jgi:hypothetical protein